MENGDEEEEGELSLDEHGEVVGNSHISVLIEKKDDSCELTSNEKKEEKSEGELSDTLSDDEPNLPLTKIARTITPDDNKHHERVVVKKCDKHKRRRRKRQLNRIAARLGRAFDETDEDSINHTTLLAQLENLQLTSTETNSKTLFYTETGVLLKYKTNMLQTAVMKLVEGTNSSLLHPQHVVVIWLSMISANLFLNNPSLFPSLSSLSPSLSFLLHHPGTETFAKLGLESFLFKPEATVNKKRKQKIEKDQEDEGEVPRIVKQKCSLNLKMLNKNNFPLPKHVQKNEDTVDTSDYLSFFDKDLWPNIVNDDVNSYPMYAVDCEMVETTVGQELVRVSIVDEKLVCVYDTLVKPSNTVLDYKTQYSGVTEQMLEDISTSLTDVHKSLVEILPPWSILVGQSLENDFHALKLIHPFVIDTSYLFTNNVRFKPKLQFLAKKFLSLDIQTDSCGHSSVEDARTCMQLVLKKLQLGDYMSIQQKEQNILTDIANQGHKVAMIDRSGVVKLFGEETSRCVVKGDEDVLGVAKVVVPLHRLTFLQLHGYEDFLRSSSSSQSTLEHDKERVLRQLDSEAQDIITSCPAKTLVLVVCGSSNIRELKNLQRRKETEKIKELVAEARTGLAIAFIT